MQLKEIEEQLALVHNLEELTQAYEEISVMRMQLIRQSVISTRSFLQSMNTIFIQVKNTYKQQVEQLTKNKKTKTFSLMPDNGKDVFVFLSANTKLYGDIITKTFETFLQLVEKQHGDIVIVGSLGKTLYETSERKLPYTYFQLPDTTVSQKDILPLLTFIASYKTVTICYGKFENIVVQNPQTTIISGQQDEVRQTPPPMSYHFLYEPSLETILHFFESQVFSSLFQQMLHEHELARYASRITAMESAAHSIHTQKQQLSRKQKIQEESVSNLQQRNALAGMSLWKRKRL